MAEELEKFNLLVFQRQANSITFHICFTVVGVPRKDPFQVFLDAAQRFWDQSRWNTLNVKPRWEFYTKLDPQPFVGTKEGSRLGKSLDNSSSDHFWNHAAYYPIMISLIETIADELGDGNYQVFATFDIPSASTPLASIAEHPNDRDVIAHTVLRDGVPSAAADRKNLYVHQRKNKIDAMYNGRPAELSPSPIVIYHPVFGQFLRQCSNPKWADREERKWYYQLAYDLQQAAVKFYISTEHNGSETARQDAMSPLGSLLGRPSATAERSFKLGSGLPLIKLDGHVEVEVDGKHRVMTLIVEMKTEVGEGGCDPLAQAECGYKWLCSNSKCARYRAVSCCPVFLLTISGPNLLVAGAIFADRFMQQRLTSMIYMNEDATQDSDESAQRLANILRALRSCLDTLDEYYLNLFPSPSSSRSSNSPAQFRTSTLPQPDSAISPFIAPFFKVFEIGEKRFELTYNKRVPSVALNRPVYDATCHDGNASHRVIVKFTKHYSKQAHQLLEGLGFAPKLWYCESLEGVKGWLVVVMEYVEKASITPNNKMQITHAITRAVQTLHNENLVHGDLRAPNILSTNDGIKIVDFDWAGEHDKVVYPLGINMTDEIGWHEEVEPGETIRKTHDQHMLDQYVEYVNLV